MEKESELESDVEEHIFSLENEKRRRCVYFICFPLPSACAAVKTDIGAEEVSLLDAAECKVWHCAVCCIITDTASRDPHRWDKDRERASLR